MTLELPIPGAVVRSWQAGDLAALVRHANDWEVARQLRDRFPHPYELAHGRGFLQWVAEQPVETAWAIAVDGAAVGGIGFELGHDVERVSAEVGYWLGKSCWGRGLATAAVVAVTNMGFEAFDLTRIFALPFEANAGSIRVLEKAGFVLEGRLHRSAIKEGTIRDQRLYARYRV